MKPRGRGARKPDHGLRFDGGSLFIVITVMMNPTLLSLPFSDAPLGECGHNGAVAREFEPTENGKNRKRKIRHRENF